MGVLVFGNIFIQLYHGTMADVTRCVVNIKSASGVSCNKFNNIQREQMKFAIGVRGVRFSVDIKMSVLVGFELDENHVFGTAVESQITGLRFLHENIGGRKIFSGQRHERSKSVKITAPQKSGFLPENDAALLYSDGAFWVIQWIPL